MAWGPRHEPTSIERTSLTEMKRDGRGDTRREHTEATLDRWEEGRKGGEGIAIVDWKKLAQLYFDERHFVVGVTPPA